MKLNHTPTPWQIGDKSELQVFSTDEINGLVMIADTVSGFNRKFTASEARQNAAFIVRACNAHDALVECTNDYLQVLLLRKAAGEYGSVIDAAITDASDALAAAGYPL